jgi:HAMP domain-containing protein
MFLEKLKLGPKFNILLALVFVAGFGLSGLAMSQVLAKQAEADVTAKAQVLIQAMNSVRDYTSTQIQPLLKDRLETEPAFIPETVPAYSATEVFERLRKDNVYQDFFYKEATLNPTNLRDKADSFEANLVEQFRKDPNKKELSGFRDLPGGKIFYIAHPLSVSKESCLRCHSTPDRAPKSQIATYGTDRGFGWQLNEIVAAQTVSVPAEEVINNARQSLWLILAILLGIFVAILGLVNYLLTRSVIRPIRQMARTAEAVSMGHMEEEFNQKSQDEIGSLAAAFNRMKSSLEISMSMLNKRNQQP